MRDYCRSQKMMQNKDLLSRTWKNRLRYSRERALQITRNDFFTTTIILTPHELRRKRYSDAKDNGALETAVRNAIWQPVPNGYPFDTDLLWRAGTPATLLLTADCTLRVREGCSNDVDDPFDTSERAKIAHFCTAPHSIFAEFWTIFQNLGEVSVF